MGFLGNWFWSFLQDIGLIDVLLPINFWYKHTRL